ncbi:MAG: glycogen/starch/alpha-glucan phosphorylase [Ruminococcaceae bacterium]|nr:glycogen/starch/alpha-glucan phosphorylase [Oscillospiraceae bacterium]
MNYTPTKKEVRENIEAKLSRYFGCTPAEASRDQMYKAVSMTVKDILTEKRGDFKHKVNDSGAKRVYYMSIEFLLGRSLKTNLNNLGLADEYNEALKDFGYDLETVYECEPDAGLGNGGLGRLAACFMDSLSSLDYPATGFSICYEYGLFKQMIVDGMQVELPDIWLPGGEVWLVPRTDRIYHVKMGGRIKENWKDGHLEILYEDCEEIEAVPYDMMISGADSEAVSQLRLWKARDIHNFNMGLFTQGQYARAVEESTNAEIISKVLYPSDNHMEGKLLRLSQQYFMVSASCQSIIRDHMAVYGTLDNLADKVAIHINDTHPALCIPELMRILVDEYFYDWDRAWDMVCKVCSYTNHTVMPEALETWNEDLFGLRLPRIHSIIKEINGRFCREAWKSFPGNWNRISKMSIIGYGQVRMANLCVVGSHSVNGVSKLHSDILTKTVFKDFYAMYPEKFCNVTNGIAHRRWLCYSNPSLAGLLDECIGTGYRHDPQALSEFAKFADNKEILEILRAIKHQNKIEFSNRLYKKTGKAIDTHSLFDVHVKRLHEYKRQLLNTLNIIGLYLDIKENPNKEFQPQSFIFAAKAAPGYYMAKNIIKLIYFLGKEIENDPVVREKLSVNFLEDYNVSMAESLIPAAEISEQISLAGKEASGTGCMKLMINGAMTLGTLDGANIEMLNAVGKENMYIFGLTSAEVDDIWFRGYNSAEFYANNERIRRIVSALNTGFAGESFSDIANYLISGPGIPDPYMCLADFDSYHMTRERAIRDYADKEKWNRMSLMNIAAAGYFAADRSIDEYAQNIWNLKKMTGKKS